MTLYKQIAILVTAVFIILLLTILTISFSIVKDSVQKELYENAQNSVSSLSLSIYNTNISQGNIETMINATFDNGNYERITYKHINEQIQYERELEKKEKSIPLWFERIVEIKIPVAKATLSSNWEIIGILEILNDKNTAYMQLYNMMTNMFLYLSISCVVFLIILYYLSHILLKPLLQIKKQAHLLLENKFIIQKELPRTKEFRIVINSINSMIKKFESIFKTANETLSKNKELLYLDNITNIPNRKYFILKATEYLSEGNEKSTGITIILSLKRADIFNQTIGYKNTDLFFYNLAQYIQQLTKCFDDALVCRLSGTEIVIMIPKIKIENSKILAEDIISYVNNKIEELNLNKNKVGIYLAILPYEKIDNVNNLFSLIDYSLAQSKLLPYSEYYTLRNLNVAIGRDKWRENINYALENDKFEIVYRKVIDIELKQKIYNGVSFNLNIKDYSYSYGTFIAPVVNLGLIEDVYLHIIKKVLLSNNAKENISTTIQLSALFLNNLNTYEKLKQLFINTTKQNKYNLIFEIPESFINKYYENSLL
ncbi:MAG: LapD/MoxY N-terminal periplasmic domain-containing protein [Candidatus Gracilibacteria bacterium]|nr:LapD/MoxY N-terminal periplasmic domain-containing protein [Candidatus Gracilibacteria bacterium]